MACVTAQPDTDTHAVQYNGTTNTYVPKSDIEEIPAQITLGHPNTGKSRKSKLLNVFPDSGASICLAVIEHIEKMGVKPEELVLVARPSPVLVGY